MLTEDGGHYDLPHRQLPGGATTHIAREVVNYPFCVPDMIDCGSSCPSQGYSEERHFKYFSVFGLVEDLTQLSYDEQLLLNEIPLENGKALARVRFNTLEDVH
jgi:hypothetical protein